jgi:hypothetical protein
MKFILTIDTEGDNQWDHGRPLTVENIKYVPRFQELCNKYNIKPTYLITSEICEDPYSKEIFTGYIRSDQAEIGAHLHSWTTPPFLDKDGFRYNDRNHPFATELPDDLLSQKIKTLTTQIEDSFGIHPTSFRSGRYGFDSRVARILVENSYVVDSSVTPFSTWAGTKGLPGGKGGPDFIDNTPFPCTYDFETGSLVEIPVTILPTRFPLNKNNALIRQYLRNVNKYMALRILRRIMFRHQPLWLRPHIWMNSRIFEELLKETIRIELPYIVMMFHSSELMPGCSSYRPDEKSIEKLYDLLEGFFISLQSKKIESISLTEAGKVLSYENMFLG